MKIFVKTVPLVKIKNIIYPEIKISKFTVLNIEYPINIISHREGLSYKGNSGSFNYYFKKDRQRYKLYFSQKNLYLSLLNDASKMIWTNTYKYGEIIKFINAANKDATLLF